MPSLKRLLIGRPIATERAHDEKLRKLLALPIFASDALSSVAYASEEIMAALLVAGAALFYLTPWLSLAIIVLLAIVVTSYRQIVMAYPNGGGAYIVAKDNLGEIPAQTAGASLLVDYILTVAVSVSAGVAAVKSLVTNNFPQLHIENYTVELCVLSVILIAVVNLRGVKESGAVFAVPAYTFIALMYVMIGVGLYHQFVGGGLTPIHSDVTYHSARAGEGAQLETVGLFLILHAFASGCTALTGVEAISNGVQAFRPPESKNAAITMAILGVLLGTIFLGLSYLAVKVNALPSTAFFEGAKQETVMSQVGRAVFNSDHSAVGSIFYWALQIVTAIILILAANTSFAGFPRLCALQAQDGFLPKQLSNIGDRLVYDNGIKILAFFSMILIVLFHGDVHKLIPLYAIGVFLSFTISQGGMVKRWLRLRGPGWQFKAFINGFGAICTFVVLCIFGIVKFAEGAWVVVILIPALILLFFRIKKHYRSVSKQLSLEGYRPAQGVRHHVYVLVPDIHRGVIPALQYARSISPDAKALHVSIDPSREARLRDRWTLYSRGVPLTILESPYRSLVDPIVAMIEHIQAQEPNSIVTLVVPEFLPTGLLPKLLHGQAALMLNVRLHSIPGVIVIPVPYHIEAFVAMERGYDSQSFRAEATARKVSPRGHLSHRGGGHSHHDHEHHDHDHHGHEPGMSAHEIAASQISNAAQEH